MKPPEAVKRRDGDNVKYSTESTDSNQSPPFASSKGGRKSKHQEDLKSLGTSKSVDVPHDLATSLAPPKIPSLFDLVGMAS
jgi:hypothetical protein